MPYITQSARSNKSANQSFSLDELIEMTVDNMKVSNNTTDEELLAMAGDINYLFSSIIARLMANPSYKKIALVTGVLENIKQEFYRRVASQYEDMKKKDNGDIKGYSDQK